MVDVMTGCLWIVGALFAVAATLAVVRIVRGPTIVDRIVGSDTLLTILICVMGADMVVRGHTTNLPLMLGLAMTAFIASVAVARHVSRQEPLVHAADGDDVVDQDAEPEAPGELETADGERGARTPAEVAAADREERA